MRDVELRIPESEFNVWDYILALEGTGKKVKCVLMEDCVMLTEGYMIDLYFKFRRRSEKS